MSETEAVPQLEATEEVKPAPEPAPPEPAEAKPEIKKEVAVDATEQLDKNTSDAVDQLADEVGMVGPMPSTTSFNMTTTDDREILDKVFDSWSNQFSKDNAVEVEKWTADQYRERYAQNVTNAYNMVRIASDDKAQTQYATYGNFVRDSHFNMPNIGVYYDEGTKTAWFSVGNDDNVNTQLRLMGRGGANAIINSPSYGRIRQALYEFAIMYADKATHMKLGGYSAGATMLMQLLLRDQSLKDNFTFVSLFNMPRANDDRQRANFKQFLDQNPQVALFGAEFDRMDPYHRLFDAKWRNHVLGAETNKQLNLTRKQYQRMLRSSQLQPANIGSKLDVWGDFFNETPLSEKDLVDEITGRRVVPEGSLNEVNMQQVMLSGGQTSFMGYQASHDIIQSREYNPGWNPVIVQMGGESGLGEGEEFIVYKWGRGGQWANDAFRLNDDGLMSTTNFYQPWHEHRVPYLGGKEIDEAWDNVGDGLDRSRRRIYKDLEALYGGTDAFGREYEAPFMRFGKGQVNANHVNQDRRYQILYNLFNVRDPDVMKQIKRSLYQIKGSGKKRGYGGASVYDDPSKQFVGIGPNGKKQLIMNEIERVFYPAVAAYVERSGQETSPNPYLKELASSDTQTNAWSWWTRQARDITNFSIQPVFSAGIAWLISKGLLGMRMGQGGIAGLPPGEAQQLLGYIQQMNMNGGNYVDPQILNRIADLVPLAPQAARMMIENLHTMVVDQYADGINNGQIADYISRQINIFIAEHITGFTSNLLKMGAIAGGALPRYLRIFDDVGDKVVLRESDRKRREQRYANLGAKPPRVVRAYLPAPVNDEEVPEDFYAKYIVEVLLPARRNQNMRPESFESFWVRSIKQDRNVLSMGPTDQERENPLARDPEYRRIEERRYILERQLNSRNLSEERRKKLERNLAALNNQERSLRDAFNDLLEEGRGLYVLFDRFGRGYSETLDNLVDTTANVVSGISTGVGATVATGIRLAEGTVAVGQKVVDAFDTSSKFVVKLFKQATDYIDRGEKKVEEITEKATKLKEKAENIYKKTGRLAQGIGEKVEEAISATVRKGQEVGDKVEEAISATVRKGQKLGDQLEEGISRVARPAIEAEEALRRTASKAKKFTDLMSLERAISELRNKIYETPNGFKVMEGYQALAKKLRAAKATVDSIRPQNNKQAKQKKKIKKTLQQNETSFVGRLRAFFAPASGSFKDSPQYAAAAQYERKASAPMDPVGVAGQILSETLQTVRANAQRKKQSEEAAINMAFQGVDPQEALRATEEQAARDFTSSWEYPEDPIEVERLQREGIGAADQGIIQDAEPFNFADEDDMPSLEKAEEANLRAGLRMTQLQGEEADKLNEAQRERRDAAQRVFQGVDPQEALRAGREFYAQQMNQDYRNIDGVEVTGALGAADKGIIQDAEPFNFADEDDMPSLEKDPNMRAAIRFRNLRGSEADKMNEAQRNQLKKALSLEQMRKNIRTLNKALGSKKGREKLKKRNVTEKQAKATIDSLKETVEVVESSADKYEVSEEFINKQLDAIANDVATTKKMLKQKNRAEYLRKTLAERLEYMPRVPKKKPKESITMPINSKKKFMFKKPVALAENLIREEERFLEQIELEYQDYNFAEDAVATGIGFGLTAIMKTPIVGGGMKAGAAIGTGLFGPVGTAPGGFVGGLIASMYLGVTSKKVGDEVVKYLKKKYTKKGYQPSLEERRILLQLDGPDSERRQNMALAATVGGVGQFVWNRVNPVARDQRWRGPAHELQEIRRLLPADMLDLLARARVNFPHMFLEANYAGPGAVGVDAQIGSWQTYLHRMAYMDPAYARRVLGRLANAPQGNSDFQAAQTGMQLYTDWLTSSAWPLFYQVYERAAASAAIYGWYDNATKQYGPRSMGIIGEGGRPRQTPFAGDLFRLAPRNGMRRAQRLVPPAGPPARRRPGVKVKKEKKPKKRRRAKQKPKEEKRVARVVRKRPNRQRIKKEGEAVRRDSLLKLFKRLDRDKSGQLSVKEVGRLSKRLKLSAKEIMKRMDKSGNNGVDFKEFVRFMRSRAA